MALITDLITKKQRNRIDHRRVACFCDTSSPNALAQCQAYYAAYPDLDPSLIFQYDLSTPGAKDKATGWSLWFSDWAEFLIDNNIEAICCNPELDLDNPWGYTFNVSGARDVSFLSTLAGAKQYKDYIAKVGGTELGNSIGYEPSDTFYSPGVKKRVWWQHFGGKLGDSDNPTLPESIVTGEGDNLYDYTDKDFISEYSSRGKLRGYFCGEFDIKTDFFGQPISMLPSWRIGWKSGSNNPAEITTTEITAMVERSKSTKGSIQSHIDDPIVSSSRRRYENFFTGQAMTVDVIAKDMGFTDVKWGYSEKGGGVSQLTTWNSKLITNNYDPDETSNTNVAFIENDVAGTVGNTYRDISSNYSSGTYRWHAHNTNTFPMPAFIYIGGCLVNQNQQTNGSWCDGGSDAIFDVKDGAFFMDMTSHFLYTAGWAIKNGASGVFGSYEEPGAGQVANGSAIMSNLLRGHQLATSVLFGQYASPKSTELWGDGLAAPYYYESTEEEDTMKHKKTITVATSSPNDTIPTTANTIGYYGFGSTNPYAQRGGGSGGRKFNQLVVPEASPVAGRTYTAYAYLYSSSLFLDYIAVAGDTQEDVVDGILASNYNNSTELENTFYLEKVAAPAGGDYAGQFGIQISGAADYYWSSAMNYAATNYGTLNPTGWLASGVAWPEEKLTGGVDTLDNYYDKNGDIAFQFGFVNLAVADRSLFVDDTTGWPNDTVTGFMLSGIDAAESASVISQYQGTTPKIEKITFKNISSPESGIADIVLTREDFLPYVSQYSIYLLSALSGVNGSAYRALPFIANNNYEATIEFSASDLGISSGSNKSVISRSIISHNTES